MGWFSLRGYGYAAMLCDRMWLQWGTLQGKAENYQERGKTKAGFSVV